MPPLPFNKVNQNINNNQNTSAENNISENYSDNQENTIQQTEDEIAKVVGPAKAKIIYDAKIF